MEPRITQSMKKFPREQQAQKTEQAPQQQQQQQEPLPSQIVVDSLNQFLQRQYEMKAKTPPIQEEPSYFEYLNQRNAQIAMQAEQIKASLKAKLQQQMSPQVEQINPSYEESGYYDEKRIQMLEQIYNGIPQEKRELIPSLMYPSNTHRIGDDENVAKHPLGNELNNLISF